MSLRYHTGIATFIQFIVLSFLSIINGIGSVIATCGDKPGSCLTNAFTTVVLFLGVSLWFASIWILGYLAQDRRSRRLAALLIVLELPVIMVAIFNIQQHTSALSVITSFIDIALALWVIYLAGRLIQARGGRIVAKTRPRSRQTTSLR